MCLKKHRITAKTLGNHLAQCGVQVSKKTLTGVLYRNKVSEKKTPILFCTSKLCAILKPSSREREKVMTYTKLETYLTSKKCCLFGTWNREHPPPPTVEHGCVGVELLGCYSASGARSLLRVWIRSEKNVLENIVKKETKNQAVIFDSFIFLVFVFLVLSSTLAVFVIIFFCPRVVSLSLFSSFFFSFSALLLPLLLILLLFLSSSVSSLAFSIFNNTILGNW